MAPDILHMFEAEPQLSVLTLKNKALQSVHALPLFRALQCHDCLTELLLPGNRIGTESYCVIVFNCFCSHDLSIDSL